MRINVHAGHNPTGKPGCGAVGIIDESTESRRVKDEVISQLRQLGHEVYDCTVNDGSSQSDVLKKIVKKCNSHEVDLDLGIHFNFVSNDWMGKEESAGTEAYIDSENGTAKEYAQRICEKISQIGFRNRGVKEGGSLYVLRMTNAPAILLECCYVDHKGDVERYDYRSMASAIVFGITGRRVAEEQDALPEYEEKTELYRVQAGSCRNKENAVLLQKNLELAGFEAVVIRV